MSELNQLPRGPVMIAATTVMKPGGTRIGHIGGNISLPRTVSLKSLVAGGGGAFIGIIFGLLAGAGVQAFIWGIAFGGIGGVFLATYEPIEGESMLRWISLSLGSQRGRTKRSSGDLVKLSIGICRIQRAAYGPVRIVRGAINVPPSQFDSRGVQISVRNKNLDLGQRSADLMAGLLDGRSGTFPSAASHQGESTHNATLADILGDDPAPARRSRLTNLRHKAAKEELAPANEEVSLTRTERARVDQRGAAASSQPAAAPAPSPRPTDAPVSVPWASEPEEVLSTPAPSAPVVGTRTAARRAAAATGAPTEVPSDAWSDPGESRPLPRD